MTLTNGSLAGSFRDPGGFVFAENDHVHRQVNQVYRDDYDLLMDSGLYEKLVGAGLLIPHEEVGIELARTDEAYKVLRPEPVPFVSYPYEWCFSQLKDAALATLAVQKQAFEHGMVLKDSSAYNIQFVRGKPVLIDTLSFEKYREGMPWVAYRQFCQHFLAPLALMSYRDVRLGQLLRIRIDGIPLDLASRLLPMRTRFRFSLLAHIHLHARSQKRHEGHAVDIESRKVSRLGFRGIIDSLESAVRRLSWRPTGTEWAEYYEETLRHSTKRRDWSVGCWTRRTRRSCGIWVQTRDDSAGSPQRRDFSPSRSTSTRRRWRRITSIAEPRVR